MTTEATTTATTSTEAAAVATQPATQNTTQSQTDSAISAASNSGQPAGKFFDTFKDETLKGYVQNKGFEDPEALANSYMNLEKLVGKEKVPMPKDENDVEGWNKVYSALGRPEKADGYKLPVPEGDTGEFAKTASQWFHEAGISQRQAEKIAAKWNEFQAGMDKEMPAAAELQGKQDLEALKKEWGQAFDEKTQTARQYAKEIGISEQEMSAIESIVGTKRFLSMFAEAGQKLAEAPSIGFEQGKSTGKLTPAQAKAKVEELKRDKEWTSRYLNGGSAERAEMEKLMQAITAAA